jgi:hypothetical protein
MLVNKISCKYSGKFLPFISKPKSTTMKKLLIGALVGGLIIFGWQTASWTFLKLHSSEMMQAKDQDAVMNYLSTQFSEDGQYMIPRANDNATSKEMEDFQKNQTGKPWAMVSYHKAYDANMMMNMIRGLLSAMIAAFFVCWILMKQSSGSSMTTFISCLLIGVAGYLFIPYAGHIWMENPGAMQNLLDVIVSWGVCGIWLGWWLNRK